MHAFGLWEQGGVPGEDPTQTWEEHPHRKNLKPADGFEPSTLLL